MIAFKPTTTRIPYVVGGCHRQKGQNYGTPTKGYALSNSGEKHYYCANCSSVCAFCSGKATTHYTAGLRHIIFACDTCYKQVRGSNS